MRKISICIPTWEFGGLGAEVLGFSFQKMRTQLFKDFEVCVSDNSDDNKTEILCQQWSDLLDIKYLKNPVKGAATNSNKCIEMASAPLIKFLCADDFLYDNDSLLNIYEGFDDTVAWLFTEYIHTTNRINYYRHFIPSMNPNIALINTLGTPSGLSMRNTEMATAEFLFDTNLKYFYDCDFYYRMNNVFGPPKILPVITMANYIWPESVTSNTTEEMMQKEVQYILCKYGVK
jgi:glycosyltransferase involved in cell wall biosynthesis